MKKIKLFVLSLMITSFLTCCSNHSAPTIKTHIVTFDSNGGSSVLPQEVIENNTAVEPKDPNKNATAEFTFQFKEWQLDGAKYDFSTPITKDITLKAIWTECKQSYTITFDSDGGTLVEPQTKQYGDTFDEPEKPSKPSTKIATYTFKGWHQVIDGVMQKDLYDFSTPVSGNINLKAEWTVDKFIYKISATDGAHLEFLVNGNSFTDVDATAGEPFSFNIKVTNPLNDYDYVVPSELKILIDDVGELLDGYTITPMKDETEAVVTISGDRVIGNVTISGEAIQKGSYHYKVPYCYGLENIEEKDVSDFTKPLVLSFVPTSGYTLPKAENIYIKFDKCPTTNPVQWVSPAEDLPNIDKYCSYDEESGDLTIKTTYIRSNIAIIARANNFCILEKLEWEQIAACSMGGSAPFLFYIGEEKTVEVNGINHEVRIIDFAHDIDLDGNLVGITFEFKNVITNNEGAVTTHWNDKTSSEDVPNNKNFPNSTLNDLLNEGTNCVFKNLPEDLQNVIKMVNKKVGINDNFSTQNPYPTKLFPLAHDEMADFDPLHVPANEGTIYQYYKYPEKYDSRRIKTAVNLDTEQYYWLRSPDIFAPHITSWTVHKDGMVLGAKINKANYGIAPAFCV